MGAGLTWFDAHLDLAYLAVNGRHMLSSEAAALDSGPHPPGAISVPSLIEGGVRFALGTIFTEPAGTGPEGYPAGDVARARVVGRAQMEVYQTWRDRAEISLDLKRVLGNAGGRGLGEIRGGMGVAEVVPLSIAARLARVPRAPRLHLGVLVEGADPIGTPDELRWWVDRGVVAVGLTWARSSRFAGGNADGTGIGLSEVGRAMVREMDRLGVVHDVSHLSDSAFEELMEVTERTVMASHSNCRGIVDPAGTNQRHLTDAQIARIAERGGVVGLNLYSRFIEPGIAPHARASVVRTIDHVERVCEIAERVSPLRRGRAHVGLGSDADGGFAGSKLVEGINRPRDYSRLAEELSRRGWSDEDVVAFACGNWMRAFEGQRVKA